VNDRQAGPGPSPRRAGLRALPTPVDVEIYVNDAPPLFEVIDDLPEPRIAELDALLRDVDALRCTMRRDLTLAATAAEAGADDLAGWLLLGEDGEVRAFEQRALAHLDALKGDDEPTASDLTDKKQRRVHRMMPAAPLVAAAAAVVGFLSGVVPSTGGAVTSPKTSNAALQSYAQLTELASHGASASSISAAAQRFHADLAPLVADANTNPAAAEKAIALLQTERVLIAGEADSPALRAVLAQADALVVRLRATLPRHSVRVIVPPADMSDQHSRHRSNDAPRSTPAARPAPSPTAAPKATPSAAPSTKPSPSPSRSSAQPASSPSANNGLPQTPGTLPG
jgi:hypothetical protein